MRCPENEDALIGCILFDPKSFLLVSVEPEAFTQPHTFAAWSAAKELSVNGVLDPLAIISKATRITAAPVRDHLDAILDRTYTAADITYHAKCVTDAHRSRKLTKVAGELIETVKCGTEPLIAFNGVVTSLLDMFRADVNGQVSAFDLAKNMTHELVRVREGGLIGQPTGFPRLDQVLSGLIPGELYCLSAWRAGGGKSSLAMQLTANVCERGVNSLVFSAELSAWTLFLRETSRRSGVPIKQLFTDDPNAFKNRIDELAHSQCWFDTTEMPTSDYILSSAMMRHMQNPLGLVCVDMIQHIDGPGATEFERIGNAVKALKKLAKTLNVPVICVSAVNRRRDEHGLPDTANLYGSSWIDSLAAYIGILVPAKEYYEKMSAMYEIDGVAPDWEQFWKQEKSAPPDKDALVLMSRKNRHGPQWSVPFEFDGATYRFTEVKDRAEWLAKNGRKA